MQCILQQRRVLARDVALLGEQGISHGVEVTSHR